MINVICTFVSAIWDCGSQYPVLNTKCYFINRMGQEVPWFLATQLLVNDLEKIFNDKHCIFTVQEQWNKCKIEECPLFYEVQKLLSNKNLMILMTS
jgi:hypothetical protein